MAVYGRSREKWDPTKSKSKVSKNRKYELSTSSVPETQLAEGKVLFYMDPDRVVLDSTNPPTQTDLEGILDVFGDDIFDIHNVGGLEISINPVNKTHFALPTISFPRQEPYNSVSPSPNRVYIQNDGTSFHGFTLKDLASGADHRTWDTFFSFWVKVSELNSGTDRGHCIGGFYRGIAIETPAEGQDTTTTLRPAVLFGITSSGQPELRFCKDNFAATEFLRFEGPAGAEDLKIQPNEWTHVTMAMKTYDPTVGVPTDLVEMWINGVSIAVTQHKIGSDSLLTWASSSGTPLGLYNESDLSGLFGNHTRGYSSDNDANESQGFFGSFGQLLVFTQPSGFDDPTSRNNIVKFVYEAQREGAYHLHSGIHSSSPRLEQLDLDKDSLYPPNFTLENYTMGAYQPPQERKNGVLENSTRVSSRSDSRYTEGYNTDDSDYAWTENASQYFIQQTYNGASQTETRKILPHLRLNPADTILTNGNWYSDARSEFFSEDLDASSGFVIAGDGNDELYREHYTEDTVQKFVEIDVPDDYKDCFVIDIPIPNTADLTLGTDRPSVNENPRINGTAVVSNPQAKIANMAYYNFATKQWETVLDTDYDLSASSPKDTNFIDKNDIGFSPMSGLVVPNHEAHAQRLLPKYGLPTSDYGFPFDDKFNASSGQSIDLSKYIDQPVILEGWEIQTKVVPVVGYAGYTATNQNSTFYSGIGSGGKSPFHYGGHGESAVFFNHRRNMTGFDQNVIQDGSDYFHVGTTIPTTYESGGAESQPPIEQPGLVTSGITAFLLKKSKITNTTALRDAYQVTAADKTINKHSNCLSDAEGVAWSAADGTGVIGNKYEPMNEHMPDGAGVAAHPEWVDPHTDWSNYESTSLIGWLQQVYHNDEHLSSYKSRNNWVRNTDTVNSYRTTEGKQIVDMLGKEKATYVQNLLYGNTDEVDLNVRGNTKSVGKIVDGMPVTNFFITSHGGSDLGVYKSSSDDSGRYAVSTSSDTSMNVGDGSLGDHSIIPRYGAGKSTKSTIMPRLNMPTRVVSSSDTISSFHKEIKMFESIEDDSTVILSPNDELVLGIQNSISTTLASQQIEGGSSNFVRWGRTSLKIPQQMPSKTASYIRLYVKKTRSDNDFNVVADSSNYNANVNRDLGDHANADQHKATNVTMYSGSIADDIVGPTYFSAPLITQEKSLDISGDPEVIPLNSYAYSYVAVGGAFVAKNGNTPDAPDYDFISHAAKKEAETFFEGDTTFGGRGTPYAVQVSDFTIDWRFLSQRAFKSEVGQTSHLPYVPLIRPLDNSENARGTFQQSIRSVFQSILVDPANLFLKPGGTDSNDVAVWNTTIPRGDFARYTGGITESAWYTPAAGAEYYDNSRRWAMGSLSILQELDDRDTPQSLSAVSYTDGGNNAKVFDMGDFALNDPSNAASGWFQRWSFPVLQRNVANLEPSFGLNSVEFRFVRIGRYVTDTCGFTNADFVSGNTASSTNQGYGIPVYDKFPLYPSGEEMQLGDAFYIDESGNAIRLLTEQQIIDAQGTANGVDANQKWSRVWQTTKSSKGTQIIYIVSAKHDLRLNPSWTLRQVSPLISGSTVFTFSEMYDVIADILNASAKVDLGLLWKNVTANEDGKGLRVIYPDDPLVREFLSEYKNSIDTENIITLLEKEVAPSKDNFFNNAQPIYLKAHPGESSKWFSNQSTLNTSQTDISSWYKADTANSDYAITMSPTSGSYGAYLKSYLPTRAASANNMVYSGTHPSGNWQLSNGNTTAGNLSSVPNSANYLILDYGNNERNLSISWNNLPSTTMQINIAQETFTDNAPHIDRKVSFRTTQGNAGPFGSLNPFKRFIARNAIWDSIAPKLDVLMSGSIDLTQEGFPQGWLLDGLEFKEFLPNLNEIKTRVDMSNPNNFASQFVQDDYPIVSTNLLAEGGNEYQWQPINNSDPSSNWPTTFTDGIFEIKNYIQLEFAGLKDYSKKTARDLILGFGNSASSRHLIRPDVYKYKAFQVYDQTASPQTNISPTSTEETIVVDVTIDPPRGARFGLYNTEPSFPTYIFSNNSYGQLRDMFEQSLDTKTTSFRRDEALFGAPVVVSSINPVNPEAGKLMERTQRFNKTINATITKPYIESNYESTPQATNLNSEKLRVDVAGSIATKAVLAPGNVAANIRRR